MRFAPFVDDCDITVAMQERICVFGASRGLGSAVTRGLGTSVLCEELWISSRKEEALKKLASEISATRCQVFVADYSKIEDFQAVSHELISFKPTRIFYLAGGGPHGEFHAKKWEDHTWALNVSFVFPARLLHFSLRDLKPLGLKQFVAVGSSVAEQAPDPYASSYAAGKHALLGMMSSLVREKPGLDIRLFSPGYMDTAMLPANAWPRQVEGKVSDPADVAEDFLDWVFRADQSWHRVYKLEE